MNMQKLMDAMSKVAETERSKYHLTLGKFAQALTELADTEHADKPVITSDGSSISNPHSYRGYYSDLSFEYSDLRLSVKVLLPIVQKCLGETFQGYKGGDFTMTNDTPLWLANEWCTGAAIMGYQIEVDCIRLITKYVD